MRGRRLRRLLALAALAGLAAGAVMLRPRPQRATWENCNRLKEGMSRAEVESLIGPPGDHRTGPVFMFVPGSPRLGDDDVAFLTEKHQLPGKVRIPEGWNLDTWASDEMFLCLIFDPEAGFKLVSGYCAGRVEQGPFENLWWRVKRQWRRWLPG